MNKENSIKNKIVDILNTTKEYFKCIIEIIKNNEDYDKDGGLGSINNAKDIEAYEEKLTEGLNDKNIANIAISGIYGSGKSSVLKTFFKKIENTKYCPIFISLGSYDKSEIKDYNNDKPLERKNEYTQSIERSILQQILYQARSNELPLSRFNRIDNFSKLRLVFQSVLLFICLCCIIILIFPKVITTLNNHYNILENKIGFIFTVIMCLISFCLCIYIIYKIIYYLKYKLKIDRLKINDTEIEINNKNESIFNRYLDEIIYFFQATKYSVVIIEDLDRFENIAISIFEKLKELNQILNASSLISRKITFVYAIKDDFFTNKEDRTKFFESIIPIIPVASYTNSKEFIKKGIEKYSKQNSFNIELSDEFIKNISIYLGDMRLIKNVLNEFLITKRKLKNDDLNDEKMFSIIVYKNIDPVGYSSLLEQKGFIYEIFVQKKGNINKITENLKEKINKLNEKKNIAGREMLKSVFELKGSLVSKLYQYFPHYNVSFKIDGSDISITDFLDDNFDLTDFIEKEVIFYYNGMTIHEEDIFKYFNGKDAFITRLKILQETKEKYIEECQFQIDLLEKKIRNIQEMTLSELMTQYEKQLFLPNNYEEIQSHQLVSFLLERGYIDENYEMYIYNFVEGTLKYSDLKFITSVKTNKRLAYSYHLINVKDVIEELDDRDFNFDYVLNFELLEYMLTHEKVYKDKLKRLINNLKKLNSEKIHFLNEYTEKYNINNLYSYFFQNNKDFWKNLYEIKQGDKSLLHKWIKIMFLNYQNINVIDDFSSLKTYVENENKLSSIFSNITIEEQNKIFEILKQNNFKFIRLEDNDPIWLNFIYDNNLYCLNKYMIQKILSFKMIDIKNFNTMNYTLIFSNEKLKQMQNYIQQSYTDYLKNCYYLCESNNDEEELIKNILVSENVSDEDKIKILEKENIVYKSIEGFSLKLCDYIFEHSIVKINESNLEYYFDLNEDELNKYMIENINKDYLNIDVHNMITLDNGITLLTEILYSNDLNNSALEQIILDLDTLDIMDYELEKISNKALIILINKNLIPFTKENYNYIIFKSEAIFQPYVLYNIDEIILHCDTYVVDENVLKKIIDINELPNEKKIKIINEINSNLITSDNVNDIVNIIFNHNQVIINDDKFKHIFNLINEENTKVKLMNIKLNTNQISNDDIDLIKSISNDYSLENYSTVDLTNDNVILLEHLKQNKIIKNFTKRTKKIIIYNKL